MLKPKEKQMEKRITKKQLRKYREDNYKKIKYGTELWVSKDEKVWKMVEPK